MKRRVPVVLLFVGCLSALLPACSGGGSDGPSCDLDNPAVFDSTSPWPKFHRDLANTGTIPLTTSSALTVLTSTSASKRARVFPDGDAKGAFTAAPVLSNDGSVVYVGSNDTNMYALRTSDWTQSSFNLVATQAFTSAALVGRRDGKDAIFAGSLDNIIYALDDTSAEQAGEWPFFGTLPADKNLTLGGDGTVYGGSSGGLLYAVCPNGVVRYTLAIGDVSPVAIDAQNDFYVGSSDRLLRAFRNDGLSRWSVVASQPIVAAPVLEIENGTTNAVYFADLGGRVFKANGSGLIDNAFQFSTDAAIQSTPALSKDTLFFGSDDGSVHAVSTTTGEERPGWPIVTGGPVLSSPAVAEFEDQRVVVVGSNDGNLYFILDTGSQPIVSTYTIGAPVRSSPAIDFNGMVYVGADDGRVYAVGNNTP